MIIRPCATFTSDLPDDHIEDDERIVQYGGKSVAAAIGEILTGLGGAVGAPVYADEHGWELDARFGKWRLWCQVTLIEGWLLVFEDMSSWKWLRGHHPLYSETLTRLAQELARDPRFHNVEWFTEAEVMSGIKGEATPVSK